MTNNDQQISLSLKNIQFGDQNEYVHDLGCYLSQVGEKEEHFIDLILFSDDTNKATLNLSSEKQLKLKLIFKRLSTNEQVGSISFSHHQLSQMSPNLKSFFQWFTLFDNQNDDEFDGVLGDSNDQESPRVQMQFFIGESNDILQDTKPMEINAINIEKIKETDEEHQENYHSLQLQKIKKQSSCELNFQKRVESGLKRVEDIQKELFYSESMITEEEIQLIKQKKYLSIKNVSQNLYEEFVKQSQPECSNENLKETNVSEEDNSNNFTSINKLESEQLTLTSKEYQDKILQLQVILINQEKQLETIHSQYEKSITGYQKYFQDLNDENLQLKNTINEKEKYFEEQIQQLEENNKALEKQFKYMKTVLERKDQILENQEDQKAFILSTVNQIKQIISHINEEINENTEKNNTIIPQQQSTMYSEQLQRIAGILEKQNIKEETTQNQIIKLEEQLQKSNDLLTDAMNKKIEDQKIISSLKMKLTQGNKLHSIQENEIKELQQSFQEQQGLFLEEQIKRHSFETKLKELNEQYQNLIQKQEEQQKVHQKEIQVLQKLSSSQNILSSYKAKLEEKDIIHEQLLSEIEKLQILMKASIHNYESISQNDIKVYTSELELQISQLTNLILEKDEKINKLLFQNQELHISIAQFNGQKEFIDNLINEIELQKNHLKQVNQYKDKQDDKINQLQKELIKKNEQNLSLVQKLAKMQNQLIQALNAQEKIVRQAAMAEQQQQNQEYQQTLIDQFKENTNNTEQDYNVIDSILLQDYQQYRFEKLNQGIYQYLNQIIEIQNSNNGLIGRIIDQNNFNINKPFVLLDILITSERVINNHQQNNQKTSNCSSQRTLSFQSKENNSKTNTYFSSKDQDTYSSYSNTQRSLTNGIQIKKSPLQISRLSTHNLHKSYNHNN